MQTCSKLIINCLYSETTLSAGLEMKPLLMVRWYDNVQLGQDCFTESRGQMSTEPLWNVDWRGETQSLEENPAAVLLCHESHLKLPCNDKESPISF
jgi:hypothetical protein